MRLVYLQMTKGYHKKGCVVVSAQRSPLAMPISWILVSLVNLAENERREEWRNVSLTPLER